MHDVADPTALRTADARVTPLPRVDRGSPDHPFTEWVNPFLGRRLSQLYLDKHFVRGEGLRLTDAEGREYLDFIAAYGALPFGHNPPDLWQVVADVGARLEPSFVQPSALDAAGELARRLARMAPAGLRFTTFTNSGAEAVEAAIKMCRSRTGRSRILSTVRGFHGKTLGALSATGSPKYQAPFGAPAAGFDTVAFGDLAALGDALDRADGAYAAFLVEPIQGEGGVVEPPAGYLKQAQALCRDAGTLFVVDEIQTGLGRTGAMFASLEEGLTPDVMTIAKALGGGLIPIGACLATEDAYTEDFGLKHSSTFSGSALACRVGIAVLDRLERDDQALVRHAAAVGRSLKDGLEALAARFPRLAIEVRGRGLLLGLRFGVDSDTWPWSLLGYAAEQDKLTPILSSYMLNVEGIRFAPTLTASDVLRIEPPLTVTAAECQQAVEALGRALQVFETGDSGRVFGSLMTGAARAAIPHTTPAPRTRVSRTDGEGRFAFIQHPLDLANLTEFDPSMSGLGPDDLRTFVDDSSGILEPFVANAVRVVSSAGPSIYGEFIVVPRTADQLMGQDGDAMLAEVQRAVELARDRGARIVGLGAYTSPVTRNGLALPDLDVALTTGNSFTALVGLQALRQASHRTGRPMLGRTAAIVGAAGSVGRAAAALLGEDVSRLHLIGNPSADDTAGRLELLRQTSDALCRRWLQASRDGRRFRPGSLAAQVCALGRRRDADDDPRPIVESLERSRGLAVTLGVDQMVADADFVITATNSTRLLVLPEHLKRCAVVCDMSRPANVSPAICESRPDVVVIDGGLVEVPGRVFLGPFGLEPGLAFACMAETMLLALEGRYEHCSLGVLDLDQIMSFGALAERHGFLTAAPRSFGRAIADEEWARWRDHSTTA